MGLTTLCYLEKDDRYLMLHRIKKEVDVNKDKWIGVGGHFEKDTSAYRNFFPGNLIFQIVRRSLLCIKETRFKSVTFKIILQQFLFHLCPPY